MNEESRPQAAPQTPTRVSSDRVPATDHNSGEAALFDLVTESTGAGTTVTVQVARALQDHAVAVTGQHGDRWWAQTALEGIRALGATGEIFQAADLVELGVPEPTHSAQWGALLARAHKLGIIVRAGYGPSRRATVHGSVVAYWRGAVR